MTPDQLRGWRDRLRFTQAGAARALGISVSAYINYETGKCRGLGGRPVKIPRPIALACSAVLGNLPPYGEPAGELWRLKAE